MFISIYLSAYVYQYMIISICLSVYVYQYMFISMCLSVYISYIIARTYYHYLLTIQHDLLTIPEGEMVYIYFIRSMIMCFCSLTDEAFIVDMGNPGCANMSVVIVWTRTCTVLILIRLTHSVLYILAH